MNRRFETLRLRRNVLCDVLDAIPQSDTRSQFEPIPIDTASRQAILLLPYHALHPWSNEPVLRAKAEEGGLISPDYELHERTERIG